MGRTAVRGEDLKEAGKTQFLGALRPDVAFTVFNSATSSGEMRHVPIFWADRAEIFTRLSFYLISYPPSLFWLPRTIFNTTDA
jgi:hypothetical protein